MKKILKDYLTFSKKERLAFAVVVVLMAAFIVLPWLVPDNKERWVAEPQTAIQTKQDSSFVSTAAEALIDRPWAAPQKNIHLFSFDPNTVTTADWAQLGLSPKTIKTIENYRSKGGSFRSPEDIRKIWGLTKTEADRIIPYAHVAHHTSEMKERNATVPKQKAISPVDINTADEECWKTLPGIGDALAIRIVKYRDMIDGFTAVQQVGKIYGIRDSVFRQLLPYLVLDMSTVRKIDLNATSLYVLKTKLFLGEDAARAIMTYHRKNGAWAAVADLRKVTSLPDTLTDRIIPYCKVE